ncbi:MAG: DUF1989 domain-containing protein [Alphaproteobacteria bacterium]|nr:MAG: DUF1989 domain-containing protein [Alphaproteobacteria bacterium]
MDHSCARLCRLSHEEGASAAFCRHRGQAGARSRLLQCSGSRRSDQHGKLASDQQAARIHKGQCDLFHSLPPDDDDHGYGVPNTPNCRGNLAMALGPWGFNYRDIPNAFVPFMNVEVDGNGTMEIREPTSVPGDYYDLRAEMDLLIGISNCPQERNPCNGWNPTPMGVIIYQ